MPFDANKVSKKYPRTVTFPSIDTKLWTTKIEGIRFGHFDDESYHLEARSAVIDSSKVCTYVPELYQQWITSKILEWSPTHRYYTDNPKHEIMFSCDEISFLPAIYL